MYKLFNAGLDRLAPPAKVVSGLLEEQPLHHATVLSFRSCVLPLI
jgi:hypothetical protein